MRNYFVLAVCLLSLLCAFGCSGQSGVSPDQQKAFEDRNPKDFKGVPPGFGPGKGPGASGAPAAALPPGAPGK